MPTTTFGCRLRELRTEKELSLRDLAKLIGVTSTYIAQIEHEYCKPPKAHIVEKMAHVLGQNRDTFLALAGRLPDDLCEVIQSHPASMVTFLRSARHLTESQIADFARQADRLQYQNQA